jgi:hypothetical protein
LTAQRVSCACRSDTNSQGLAGGEVALDRVQLVAGDRTFDGEAALETRDPQSRPLDIELVAPHLDSLADPQAVSVDHE